MDLSKKVKLFRAMRWVSAISFIAVLFSIKFAAWIPLLLTTIIIYSVSTVYILFWRCTYCGKLYGTKFGIVSIAWPYFSHCIHCNKKLGTQRGSA